MNKTYLIALVAGATVGYFLAAKLRGTKPFSIAYIKGVTFAGRA